MKNIITIIVAIIIVFYAGMWSQKFLMEDECLDSVVHTMKMEFAILQAVIRMFPLSKQNAF